MSPEFKKQTIDFPEQLLSSKHVGNVAAESIPWSDRDPAKLVAVTELVYPEGLVYIASAGTDRLNKITTKIQAREHPKENGYTELDQFWLRACSLEANGEYKNSNRIGVLRGQPSEFNGFQIRDYREGLSPNARRIYYAACSVNKLPITFFKKLPENLEAPLLLRLGITDKQNQIDFLATLTGLSRRELKQKGAGSI